LVKAHADASNKGVPAELLMWLAGTFDTNKPPAKPNTSIIPIQNLDIARPPGDVAKLAVNLEVAFGGTQWTPALSNSFSQWLRIFLGAFSDSFQDPLVNSLQSLNGDSATPSGQATRRLLQQVNYAGITSHCHPSGYIP